MHFSITRKNLLNLLQLVIGVVERRQTMPILANALLEVTADNISLTATDLEVQLSGTSVAEEVKTPGKAAIPARKLLEIVRALPDSPPISLAVEGAKLIVKCGKSRFSLAILPATDF